MSVVVVVVVVLLAVALQVRCQASEGVLAGVGLMVAVLVVVICVPGGVGGWAGGRAEAAGELYGVTVTAQAERATNGDADLAHSPPPRASPTVKRTGTMPNGTLTLTAARHPPCPCPVPLVPPVPRGPPPNPPAQEIDYLNEGRNADRFRRNFKADPNCVVRVPVVHWQYCSPRVLVLEYMPGGWGRGERGGGGGVEEGASVVCIRG